MAWDSTRPVPWRRLVREWLLYAAIMAALTLLFMRDGNLLGILAGLFVSGPIYLGVGYVLAKFGHTRKSYRELRAETKASQNRIDELTSTGGRTATRGRPAPTKRTNAGNPAARTRRR